MLHNSGYFSEDTIIAMASPPGGAICVLRLSGPKTIEILSRISKDRNVAEKPSQTMFRAKLSDGEGRPLDDTLCVVFKNPKSYTGEDLAEIHLHGSSVIASSVIEECVRLGARTALPGEFSFRAVKNGKMTIVQAQAVADLVASQNQTATELALEKLEGSQARLVLEIAENLRSLCSLGELGIDFSDQDVDELSLPTLKKRLHEIAVTLERLEASFERGSKIQEGVSAAFIGLPNAGKSSFFNALLGEDRSIVSEIAGTTRDVVRERLTLRGKSGSVTLRLEDTAGIRVSEEPIEKIGIEKTLQSAKNADLIIFLIDPTRPEEFSTAVEAWKKTSHTQQTTLAVITKKDLIDAKRLTELEALLSQQGFYHRGVLSSQTHEGVREAVEQIVQLCAKWTKRSPGEVLLTRIEQVQAIRITLEHLKRASDATEEDLFAADIRQALQALGPVIGETISDDILGRIFSRFCIGK